ncbi:acyl-CoA dehydrogenase [Colletotrichum musicola]|uniref:Acyl-CoA dehydrogenase n=1 Tax=Colletotrichum musicola TaxID=2175873 RepID=A0A8H6N3G1_9PEZI|nr:acyl-CoA dehydrogenase [Colletotrichum musicola]
MSQPLTRKLWRFARPAVKIAGHLRPPRHAAFSTSPSRRIMETTGFTENQLTVREAVTQICAQFPNTYWQEHDQSEQDPTEFHAALARDGWLGIALPESLGGSGLGISEATMMMQTITESGAGMAGAQSIHANVYATQPLARFGTRAQLEETIPNIISGKWRACFGVTEPNAGLDTLRLSTSAKKQSDGSYLVTGQKIWITCAQVASKMILLARTKALEDCAKPSEGLSLFCINLDRGQPGLDMRKIRKMGGRAVDANEVFFEDYRIPASSLVGQEGQGFRIILHGMNAERCLLAGEALGLGYAAVSRAAEYARDRVVFRRPIGQNQGVAHPLADAYMRLEAAKLATYHAARLYDASKEDETIRQDAVGVACNSAKYMAAEAAFTACERAVLTHGGMGYAAEYDVERMPTDELKKSRAKHACRECNSRRVRCNVTERLPCSNCESANAVCEVLPSRRGRYPRKSKKERRSAAAASATPERGPPLSAPSPALTSAVTVAATLASMRTASPSVVPSTTASSSQTPFHAETPASVHSATGTGSSRFFGESNFLTLVPGASEPGSDAAAGDVALKGRLAFPVSRTSQSEDPGISPAGSNHVSPATERYLRDEGALTFPDMQRCLPALRAYFSWFHPCFPVLDRADVARRLAAREISPLLLQAMLFIGSTYCDEATILAMGFKDRSEAKRVTYSRARALFHANWEKDEFTLIQALFLCSFWRGGPTDWRDVRYWLGCVLTLAQTHGLHRSTRFITRDPQFARMRRRVWWSIYVRERQAAISLGLPCRIRDEDCDIEPLTSADLEDDADEQQATGFGSTKLEHIHYVTKMVDIARLLGRIMDTHFAPGRGPPGPAEVRDLKQQLEQWKQSLPDDMRRGPEDGQSSVLTCLIHLAYNHLRILVHRNGWLRNRDEEDKKAALAAACRISRIAEDMLAQKTLQYGQMHMWVPKAININIAAIKGTSANFPRLTSLFGALCIHAIDIRSADGIGRRLAEHRAQMCLLGLKEIQKYWRINNNVLDLFLQYLDESIAKRLHNDGTEMAPAPAGSATGHNPSLEASTTSPSQSLLSGQDPASHSRMDVMEDQYFNLMRTNWEGEDALGDLGLFLDPQLYANGPMQVEGLNFLQRCL